MQKGNVPRPAFSPTGAPQPSVGLESWTAQPRASLSDATATYQTTSRAFPEIWCPPAELQASKGLNFLWAAGSLVGKISLVWIKLEGKIIFTLK